VTGVDLVRSAVGDRGHLVTLVLDIEKESDRIAV